MKTRWLRITVLASATFALLLLTAFVLLQTPAGSRLILARARGFLHSKAGIDLQVSRMSLNLLQGAATLEDVIVRSRSAPDLPPVFRASRIYARIGVIQVIRGLIDIEELRISAPEIRCFVGEDGRTNLPARAPSSGPAPEFLIVHAEVEDGSFHFEDLRSRVALSLPRWQLSVRGNRVTLDHRIDFTTHRAASFEYQERTVAIDHVKFLATLQKSGLHIELAQVRSIGSEVSAAGSLKDFSNPALDLQIKQDVDLYELAKILGAREPVQGRLSGTILADGRPRNLQISAQFKGTGFSAGEYRRTGFDLRTRAEWSPGRVRLRSFDLDSTEGSVAGNAEFITASGSGAGSIEARLRHFNLYPVWKRLKPPFDLASRTSGKISLGWRGPFSVSTIDLSTHLELVAAQSAPGRNLLPISGTLDARMRSGRMTGTLRSFSVLGSQLDGKFTLLSFDTVDADVHGSVTDIEVLLARISQFTGSPDRSPVGIGMAGPMRFDAQVSGSLGKPTIVVSAETPDLTAGGLRSLSVKTDATIRDSQVAFRSTVTLPADATVLAQGAFDFGGQETVLTLDARTDRMPAAALLSVLGSGIPASGNLKADLHMDGPLDSLNGRASISGDQLTVYREPVGRFNAALRIAGGEIESDPFRIIRDPRNPDSDYVDAGFSYGMNSGRFRFQAAGKGLSFRHLSLPGGRALDGTVNLTASGDGTFAQPSIDVRLESDDVGIQQHPLGPLSVSAELRNEQATVEALAPRINASATVHLVNRSPYPFEGELQIRNSDLSALGPTAPNKQPLTGAVEAALKGSGVLNNPAEARFSAQIRKLDLRAGNLGARTEGMIEAEYRDRSIEILTPAIIVSGNSRLEIDGRVPLGKAAVPGSLNLKGLLDLAEAGAFLRAPDGFSAAGMMHVNVSFTGTPQQLTAAGAITLDDGSVQLPRLAAPLSAVTVRAILQDGALVLRQAGAALGEGRIALQGELPLGLLPKNLPVRLQRKDGPARFTLDIAGLRPETTGLLPQGVGGLVSVRAEGQAAGADLRTLRADIVFRDLSFKANEIEVSQKEPSTIVVSRGIASITKLSLTGADTGIEATGSAGLLPDGPLNLRLLGNFDAALLTFMNKDLKAAGKVLVQVEVGGNRRAPSLSGIAEMNGGRLTLRNPRVVADSLAVRLSFSPDRITVREFQGTLNGGSLTLDGTIGYQQGILDNFDLKATLQDVFLEFPEGLRSASNGNLTVTSSDESIVIGGTIRILESSYRDSFEVTGQVMSYLRSQRIIVEDTRPSALLSRIRFDIALRTATPLLVQNNIARVEATSNLRLVGTFYEPSLVGRVTLDQGGEIVLNQRTYYIERGTVILTDQSRIRPELDIQAETRVDTYDITMRLTGSPEKLSSALGSEPSLPESDIVSLLLTGKTTAETRGQEVQMAQSQALALIAGQAGEEVTREAREALHLSTLRIDPGGLIASESDLGARITIGEDITRNLSLAYSMNIVDGGDQIWAAQYKVTRRLTTQATRQEDNSHRFELRHDLQFGRNPATRNRPRAAASSKFTIGSIRFDGSDVASDKALREKFKLEPGDRYDFPKVQKGLDRLDGFFTSQKRLEADIRLHRTTREKTVDLDLNVNPGPVVEFSYEGMPLSAQVRKNVEEAWKDGVFDTERLENAAAVIRRALLQEGYLQSRITHDIAAEGEMKTVHFQIEPGTRYTKVPVVFPGATEIRAAELGNALQRAGLALDVYPDPQKVADYIRLYYQERGYLQASVDPPRPRLDPKTGTGEVSIPVREGPLFTIGELEFSGNSEFDYDQLWMVIPTSSGSIYSPKSLEDSIKALEALYYRKGYNDAGITYRVVQDSKTAHANVTFHISERRQSVIRDIVIEGNRDTTQDFVQRQLDFRTGDVLDFERINETRRRLYATGVYTSVDFQNEEITASDSDSREKSIRVRVRLREIRPYRLQYGLLFDTERGTGGLVDVQHLNFLGRASALGMRLRYDSDLKEARLYFNQPFVKNNFLKMDAAAFAQREDREGFSANRLGFSLIREKALQREYVFHYGYRYDHVRWNGVPPDPHTFQASVPVARLVGTVTRDTRDSILDATRGEFTSHSLEFGPRWLGSEIGFARYYGQYFRYVPLDKYFGKPAKDREGRALPASLVYAGALRLGLTSAFNGQDVISPERFFAGGGTTMRGFQQDLLGPTETVIVDSEPVERGVGGEALFLFNNEIRFPIIGILQGVGFLDIGNVYPRISDFNFSLRKSAGFGLRIKVKFIPIRFDYGFKLDRRPGESPGAFFFSIGQAF